MAIRRFSTALLICSAYGAAQNPPPSLTTIYNFAGAGDGEHPEAPLVIGEGGVLYGTTWGGGAHGFGTVFSLNPPVSPGGAWTENVLYSFQLGVDAINPNSRLVIGTGGVLYGTTSNGGTLGYGTVFSLTPPVSPGGHWTEALIHNFGATPNDGEYPTSGLTLGPEGVMYGTTRFGPGLNGTVFEVTPPASPGAPWTESVIYSPGNADDTWQPSGDLAVGSGRVLYGTAFAEAGPAAGVFALVPPVTPGHLWVETVISGTVGETGVMIGGGGALYGSSQYGGSSNGGMVFLLTPPASPGGAWASTVLLSFPYQPHSVPYGYYGGPNPGPLTLGEDGTLYGATGEGGPTNSGTVYALKPPTTPGGAWTEIVLHTFTGADGAIPTGLTMSSGGVFYGTTDSGGAYGSGTVFALKE